MDCQPSTSVESQPQIGTVYDLQLVESENGNPGDMRANYVFT